VIGPAARAAVVVSLALVLGAANLGPRAVVWAQAAPLDTLLPAPEGGSWLTVVGDGTRTLDEHAATFVDPEEAAPLLADWGWRENAYRLLEDGRDGVAEPRPYLYVNLTRFADANGAAAALPYIVQDLSAGEGHREVPIDLSVGDEVVALVAPTDGGTDYTLYVRSGALVVRISVLLADGDPIADPQRVAEAIIEMQHAPPRPIPTPPSTLPSLLAELPADLPSCLLPVGEETYDFAALVQRFPGTPGAADRLRALGWEAGAYRQFACDAPPLGGLNWLDMSIHRFASASGAADAVPFYAGARMTGTQLAEVSAMALGDRSVAIAGPSELGAEMTLYLSAGPLLLRVTGIGFEHDPRADVELVMTALYLRSLDEIGAPRATNAAPTAAPPTAPAPALPTATAAPAPPPPTPSEPPRGACDPSYPDVCIPPPPPDVDCRDVPYADIRVVGSDPHRLDGPYDGSIPNEPDGIGCEWN
jgi:hypothetical protein